MGAYPARAEGPDDEPATAEELKRELAAERDRGLRLRADFENFRRRERRERAAAFAEGRRAALFPFLPALDALDQAVAIETGDDGLREGVALARRLLRQALKEVGVEPIESMGRTFDPAVHEAVAVIPTDQAPPGTIVREIRRGWSLAGELLRAAQVEVAAPAVAEPWQ